jgi:LmbE family N-acetylglucosaminyl deacetylase
MVLAHPDDEVIFGWPIIWSRENRISLITVAHNQAKYGDGPEKALREVCVLNDVKLLDFPRCETNFYRLPPRYEKYTLPMAIDLIQKNIQLGINIVNPDCIFTHNPMGEYGHGDHRMLFNLVSSVAKQTLLLTDICFSNRCHLSSDEMPHIYNTWYGDADDRQYCKLDTDWYNAMKTVYEKNKAWSWGGHDAIKECNLYKFY